MNSSDKIKQFAKEIKQKNESYIDPGEAYAYIKQLCDMLIEAVEALEKYQNQSSSAQSLEMTAKETLSKLAVELKNG